MHTQVLGESSDDDDGNNSGDNSGGNNGGGAINLKALGLVAVLFVATIASSF